jgi:hypothetical protein
MHRKSRRLSIPLLVALAGCGGSSNGTSGQGIEVDVRPATIQLAPLATAAFAATVTSTVNTGVIWTIQEGSPGGTITSLGSYTAPASAGVFHVVATSRADPARTASATVTVTANPGTYVDPSPIGGDVVVSMDSSAGTIPVSPYIFGSLAQDTSFVDIATLHRQGGNRVTGYNWETGYSNAGSDWGPYSNDTYMIGDGSPGSDYRRVLASTYGRTGTWRNGVLLTVPTIGYAAGTWSGNATPGSSPDVLTVTPPLVGTGTTANRWRRSLPNRPGDTTHALATAVPVTSDDSVYQDDFLAWLRTGWAGHVVSATEPLFVALDNEPDLWGNTHPEIRGKSAAQHVQTGYDELASNNATYAAVVKDVLGAGALVFGPVLSGWMGFYDLGNVDASGNSVAPPAGYEWYAGYYLKKMKDASTASGKRLLDALDVHWYPEASSATGRIVGNDGATQDAATIVAREQAPRSLWDPGYLENSWISYWNVGIPGCTWGADPSKCSLKLLPTLKRMVDTYYPGTGIAVTEWSFGREMDVSGAIAAADVLGIFAREGVFAATTWPMSSSDGCLASAMKAYLSYDGAKSRFGDTYVPTTVSDPARPIDTYLSGTARGDGTKVPTQYLERITAYASYDAAVPGRVVIVALNKDLASTLNVGLRIRHNATFTRAEAYRVTGTNGGSGGCTGPVRQADVSITLTNAVQVSLPPQSVTVLVLKP